MTPQQVLKAREVANRITEKHKAYVIIYMTEDEKFEIEFSGTSSDMFYLGARVTQAANSLFPVQFMKSEPPGPKLLKE